MVVNWQMEWAIAVEGERSSQMEQIMGMEPWAWSPMN